MIWDFLLFYTHPSKQENWTQASISAAEQHGRSPKQARQLRQWARRYIKDNTDLPISQYGCWSASLLNNAELMQELCEHLQSVGKYIVAADIVEFLTQEDTKQ